MRCEKVIVPAAVSTVLPVFLLLLLSLPVLAQAPAPANDSPDASAHFNVSDSGHEDAGAYSNINDAADNTRETGPAIDSPANDGPASDDSAGNGTAAGGGAGAVLQDAGRIWTSCIEHVPDGATRPKLTNKFPLQGLAGHALTLQVQVQHGLGETVLPNGFQIRKHSDAARAIDEAGFVLPDPQGGAGPSLSRQNTGDKSVTTLLVHVVALPKKPGRHTLTFPPIPVAVARASGELMTLCTSPHVVVIEEPIANEGNPLPHPNPKAREQREIWQLARDLTYGLLVGLVVAAVVVLVYRWWKRRPKPVPPPPPPRPAWEVALEALQKLQQLDLPAQNMHAEHIDQVSDIVRVYLGDRFGFDGIESTTDETLRALRKIPQIQPVYDQIRVLLQDSDLVKFARWYPSDSDCGDVLSIAFNIVQNTLPSASSSAASSVASSAAPSVMPSPRSSAPGSIGFDQHPAATNSPSAHLVRQSSNFQPAPADLQPTTSRVAPTDHPEADREAQQNLWAPPFGDAAASQALPDPQGQQDHQERQDQHDWQYRQHQQEKSS